MAFSINSKGTPTQVISDINAAVAGAAAGEAAQLARVQAFLIGEVNALTAGSTVILTARGAFDGKVSQLTHNLQMVSLGKSGEVQSPPHKI